MQIELLIFAFVLIMYGTFTTIALLGLSKLQRTIIPKNNQTYTNKISIVVSFRNEEKNIKEFINQIEKQTFPKNNFELILVDDHSNDNSYQIAKSMLEESSINYTLLKQNSQKGKKYNIKQAIEKSTGSIIITTDADVVYRHSEWLSTINNYFQSETPDLLIMPVDFTTGKNLLSIFQILENIALTGITAGYTAIGKPFMCNGANLAFTKVIYEKSNGYNTHMHISSGEDVFLLEDVKRLLHSKIKYGYSRQLIVKTLPHYNLKDFFNQRIRWAYKSKYNANKINNFAGLLIILSNLVFLGLFVAILKQSIFIPYLSIFAIAKVLFDFLLLFLASDFSGRTKYLWWIIPFECVYWFYALIIGTCSLFWKPYWKGKKIN